MNLLNRLWIVPFLITVSSMTGEENESDEGQLNITKDQNSVLQPGYNAPTYFNSSNRFNIYAAGSFIYWQPTQENMELGIVSDKTGDLDLVDGDIVDLNFKYKPGFKVGLGMTLDYDNWDTYLQYTWLRGSHHASASVDPTNAFITIWPAWQMVPGSNQPQYVTGEETWKLGLDFIDWDLERHYYVGTNLTFRPFFGVRAAWIRQNVRVDYINITANRIALWPSTSIFQNSNSRGLGPRAGVNTNWMLGRGVRIYGNGELDILCTEYTKLRAHQESSETTASHYTVRQNDAFRLKTHLEMVLGFGWGCDFGKSNRRIDLSADYGFQVFFNQNMFRNFESDQNIGKSISPNGNLYIQGLTATLRLDY